MLQRLKSFVRAIREAEAWHGLFTWGPFGKYFIPAVSGVATMIAGVAENIPIMWITVGSVMVVALVTRLIITLKEYADLLDAEAKLFFDGMDIRTEEIEGSTFSPMRMLSVGIGLGNAADRSLCFFVEDWHLVLNDRTTTERKPILRYEIQGRTGAAYFDGPHVIDYEKDRKIRCVLKFKLRYGYRGREKFYMSKEVEFKVLPRSDGSLTVAHVDLVQREPDGTTRKLGLRVSSAVSRDGFEPRPIATVVQKASA